MQASNMFDNYAEVELAGFFGYDEVPETDIDADERDYDEDPDEYLDEETAEVVGAYAFRHDLEEYEQ